MKKRFLSLIMIPMCIFLFACSPKNELGIYEKEEEDMVTLDVWGDTSGFSTVEVNQITLTGAKDSEFVCSTSTQDPGKEGNFIFRSTPYSSETSVTVSSGTTVFWSYRHYDENGMLTAGSDTVWLEFINRKDSDIIGYAVVKVEKLGYCNYEAEVIKAVSFPKVNGKYQEVTEEQVNQLIDSAKEISSQ